MHPLLARPGVVREGAGPHPDLLDVLEDGPGLVWLRGAVDAGDPVAAVQALGALAAPLGTPVSQTAGGDRLVHVRDRGHGADDPRHRGPFSSRALSFHTDRCDLVAFACLRPAADGGETQVLDSAALADDLRRDHPDAFEVLQGVFPYKRHTVDPTNPRAWTPVPLFTRWEGRFAACYLRVLVDRCDADPELPSLTPAQRDALDLLDRLAAEPGRAATFLLQAGDVLLLNSWTTFHRRTAFRDDPEAPRHWLRLWVSSRRGRALDPRFRAHFGAVEAGAVRGGIGPAAVIGGPDQRLRR